MSSMFEIGKMYVVPWRWHAWTIDQNEITLDDQETVILLDVISRVAAIGTYYREEWQLKILTRDGSIATTTITKNATNYWKQAKNI